MLRGIQDPILRDFLEESILECFHFLQSGMNNNKCIFSQNLLNCLADKGREVIINYERLNIQQYIILLIS